MTEQEWLDCTDLHKMLTFLQGRTSNRKLRLFAAACSWLTWPHLPSPQEYWKGLVELAERYADGEATEKERDDALKVIPNLRGRRKRAAVYSTIYTLSEMPFAVQHASGLASVANPQSRTLQPLLLRDIFGSCPFRSITLNPSWLTWHDGLLVLMARKMYDGRDFSDMPVLADALEEAGCTNQDILGHCRSGGEYVRGCWLVDLVLGKS